MRLNRLFGKCIAGSLALIVILAGCGKKGDPLPPRASLPAAIADLSASAVRDRSGNYGEESSAAGEVGDFR